MLAGSLVLSFPCRAAEPPHLTEKASRYYEALLGRPSSESLYRRFVEAWREEGSTEELEAFLKKRADGGVAADLAVLARNHLLAGREKEALEAFERALAGGVEAGWIELEMARIHLRAGRFDEAIEHADKIPAKSPQFSDAVRTAGEAEARSGRGEEAIARWTKAVEATPDDLDLLTDLIRAASREGQKDAALALGKRRVEREKDPFKKVEARLDLADLFSIQRRANDALVEWSAALEASGADSWLESEILTRAEKSCRTQNGDTGWLKQIAEWAGKWPNRLEIVKRQARAQAAAGDANGAIETITGLLRRTPGDKTLRLERIELLDRGLRLDDAVTEWTKLTVEDPKNEVPWLKLADLGFRRARPAETKAALESLAKLAPDDAAKQVSQVALWLRYGLIAEGEARLQTLATGPAGALAEQALAQQFAKTNHPKESIAWWRKLGARPELPHLLAAVQGISSAGERAAAFELLESRRTEFAKSSDYRSAYAAAALAAKQPAKVLEMMPDLLRDAVAESTMDRCIEWILIAAESDKKRETLTASLQAKGNRSPAETLLLARLLVTADRATEADALLGSATEQLLRDGHIALLQGQGKLKEAVERMQQEALPADRLQEAGWQRRIATLKRAAGDVPGALAACRRWRELAPDEMGAWVEESRLLQLSNPKEAEKLLRRAVARFEKEPSFRTLLMDSVEASGDMPAAIDLAWQQYSLAETPGDQATWVRRLVELGRRNGSLEAINEEFMNRTRRDPLSSAPWLALAESAKIGGNSEQYREALQEAAKRAPRDASILGTLAALDEQTGAGGSAIARFEEIARLAPGPESARQLIEARIRNGEVLRGLQELQAMAGETGTDIRVLESTAVSVATAGWIQPAIGLLQDLDPKLHDRQSRFVLASLLEFDGREREALVMLLDLLKEPDPPAATPEEELQRQQRQKQFNETSWINSMVQAQASSRSMYGNQLSYQLQNLSTVVAYPYMLRETLNLRVFAIALKLGGDAWQTASEAVPVMQLGTREDWVEAIRLQGGRSRQPLSAKLPPEGNRVALKSFLSSNEWRFMSAEDLDILWKRLKKDGSPASWDVWAVIASHSSESLQKCLQEVIDNPPAWEPNGNSDGMIIHAISNRVRELDAAKPLPAWLPVARRWIELTRNRGQGGDNVALYYEANLIPILDAMGETDALVESLNRLGAIHARMRKASPPGPALSMYPSPGWRVMPNSYYYYSGKNYPLPSLSSATTRWCSRVQSPANLARLDSPVLRAYVVWIAGKSMKRLEQEMAAAEPGSDLHRELTVLRWQWDEAGLPKRMEELEAWSKKTAEYPEIATQALNLRTRLVASGNDKPRRESLLTELKGLLHDPAFASVVYTCADLLEDAALGQAARLLLVQNQQRGLMNPSSMHRGLSTSRPLMQMRPARLDWQKIAKAAASSNNDAAVADLARAFDSAIRTMSQNGFSPEYLRVIQNQKLVDAAILRLVPGPEAGFQYRTQFVRFCSMIGHNAEALKVAEALAAERPFDLDWTVRAVSLLPPERRNEAIERFNAISSTNARGELTSAIESALAERMPASRFFPFFEFLHQWQTQPDFKAPQDSSWRINALGYLAQGPLDSNFLRSDNKAAAELKKRCADLIGAWTNLCLDDPNSAEMAFQVMRRQPDYPVPSLVTAACRVLASGAYATTAQTYYREVPLQGGNVIETSLEFLVSQPNSATVLTKEYWERVRLRDPALADWFERCNSAKSAIDLRPLFRPLQPSPQNVYYRPSWTAKARLAIAVKRASSLPKAVEAFEALARDLQTATDNNNVEFFPLTTRALDDLHAAGPKVFAAAIRRLFPPLPKPVKPNVSNSSPVPVRSPQPRRDYLVNLLMQAPKRPVVSFALNRHLGEARVELGSYTADATLKLGMPSGTPSLLAILTDAGLGQVESLARLGAWTPDASQNMANYYRRRQRSGFDPFDPSQAAVESVYKWLAPEILMNFGEADGQRKLTAAVEKNPNASAVELMAAALTIPGGDGRLRLAKRAVIVGRKDLAKLPAEIRDPVLVALFGTISLEEADQLPEPARQVVGKNREDLRIRAEKELKELFARMENSNDPNLLQEVGSMVQVNFDRLAASGDLEASHKLLMEWATRTRNASSALSQYKAAAILSRNYNLNPALIEVMPKWLEELEALDSKGGGNAVLIRSYWERALSRMDEDSTSGSQIVGIWKGLAAVSPKMQARFLADPSFSSNRLFAQSNNATPEACMEAVKDAPLLVAAIRWHSKSAQPSANPQFDGYLAPYLTELEKTGISQQQISDFALNQIFNHGDLFAQTQQPASLMKMAAGYLKTASKKTSWKSAFVGQLDKYSRQPPTDEAARAELAGLIEVLLTLDDSVSSSEGKYISTRLFGLACALRHQDLMRRIVRMKKADLMAGEDVLQQLINSGDFEMVIELIPVEADILYQPRSFNVTTEKQLADRVKEGKLQDPRGLLLRAMLGSGKDAYGGNETPVESRSVRMARLYEEFKNAKIEDAVIRRALFALLVTPSQWVMGNVPSAGEFKEDDWERWGQSMVLNSDSQTGSRTLRLLRITTCMRLHAGDTKPLESFVKMLRNSTIDANQSQLSQTLATNEGGMIALALLAIAERNEGTLPEALRPVAKEFLGTIVGILATSGSYQMPYHTLIEVIAADDEERKALQSLLKPPPNEPALSSTVRYLSNNSGSSDEAIHLMLMRLGLKNPRLAKIYEKDAWSGLFGGCLPHDTPARAARVRSILEDRVMRTKCPPALLYIMLTYTRGTPELIATAKTLLTEQASRLDEKTTADIQKWIQSNERR